MKKILRPEIIASLLVFFVLLAISFNADTTGDTGDSLAHYMFSRYAFKYPAFFLHHWAKPLFVLLSAPFAQFGFKGIMVFNCLCATLTSLLTFYIARDLKLKNTWLVFVFMFFAPLFFKLIFSGLTEYLFGLFLIAGIYFANKSKFITAIIVVSFLPLIRSEGLIIVGVFGLYCALTRKFKLIPLLAVGQLIYTIVGAFYYKDLLWVFNKIPYASLSSAYGIGHLFDFVHRLNYVIEKPLYLLLGIGTLALMYSWFKTGFKEQNDIKIILIFGSFLGLFVAHSIFWWKGIFNSMGLPRVLNAVIPEVVLICLIGMDVITEKIRSLAMRRLVITLTVIIICVYPFTPRAEGVVYGKQLFVVEENELVGEQVIPYLEKEFPDYHNRVLYFFHPYISLKMDIDFFDPKQRRETQKALTDTVSANSVIIWDDWFTATEGGMKEERLANDKRFQLLKTFERKEKERTIKFQIYVPVKING